MTWAQDPNLTIKAIFAQGDFAEGQRTDATWWTISNYASVNYVLPWGNFASTSQK